MFLYFRDVSKLLIVRMCSIVMCFLGYVGNDWVMEWYVYRKINVMVNIDVFGVVV